MHFIAIIHKEEGSDFGVSFPDLPGCVTAGTTMEEAHVFAAEALSLHLRGMAEDGEPIPVPTELDEIHLHPDAKGGVPLVVYPAMAPKKRINITFPGQLLNEVDHAAGEAGVSRSEYLAEAARSFLGKGLLRGGV